MRTDLLLFHLARSKFSLSKQATENCVFCDSYGIYKESSRRNLIIDYKKEKEITWEKINCPFWNLF